MSGSEPRSTSSGRVVSAARVPGRSEPDRRSEMTTQWLCGEALRVLERGDDGRWLRVRGPDGYASWVHRGGLAARAEVEVAAWREAADLRSLGVELKEGDGGATPGFLPWGARAAPGPDGRVRLPDGGTAAPDRPDGLVTSPERAERFPPRGEAVVATALRWRGVPYLWGGRTRGGADCSGFVQSIFAVHGVRLPRDSGDQLAADPAVPSDDAAAPARTAGDLLFFGDGPDDVTHVALSAGGGGIVHAAAENGAVEPDDLEGEAALPRRLRRRLVAVTRPLARRREDAAPG